MYTILWGQGKGGFTCVSIVIQARLHAVSRLFIIDDYMMQPVSLYMQSRTKDARQRVNYTDMVLGGRNTISIPSVIPSVAQ